MIIESNTHLQPIAEGYHIIKFNLLVKLDDFKPIEPFNYEEVYTQIEL